MSRHTDSGGTTAEAICGTPSIGRDIALVLTALASRRRLTPTLQERLLEIASGANNAEIATKHGISLNTVKTEVAGVLLMLHCRCRHQLELAARVAGSELGAGGDREAIATQVERYLGLDSKRFHISLPE